MEAIKTNTLPAFGRNSLSLALSWLEEPAKFEILERDGERFVGFVLLLRDCLEYRLTYMRVFHIQQATIRLIVEPIKAQFEHRQATSSEQMHQCTGVYTLD